MVFISRLSSSSIMSDKNKAPSKDSSQGEGSHGDKTQENKLGADPADVAAIEQAALSRVTGGRSAKREPGTMKLNPAFDSWLEGKLNKIFDTASVEPLPQDLVKLLEKIDQADAASKKKN
jgi:hypothetical protein